MTRTYNAILRGNRIEWLDGAPETNGPVEVQITLPDAPKHSEAAGKTALEALQALADMGAFDDIEDPVAWIKEQRRGV